jgi:serine/threonine protein kinase
MDFGEHLTCTGAMLGTPGFIAPEQIVDSQRADIRADIYSLGCTL